MPGSKENYKAKDIHEYLKNNYPDLRFLSRKRTNTHALLIERKSGRVIKNVKKNWEMAEIITSKDFKMKKQKHGFGLEEYQILDQRTEMEKAAEYILDWFKEFEEWASSSAEIKIKGDKRAVFCDNEWYGLTPHH